MALEVKTVVVSPIPWWVGPYAYFVGLYLDGGGSSYLSSPPGSAVLSAQRGAGMAFVRTERIVVPSVLME
jgi:hypothetical protein